MMFTPLLPSSVHNNTLAQWLQCWVLPIYMSINWHVVYTFVSQFPTCLRTDILHTLLGANSVYYHTFKYCYTVNDSWSTYQFTDMIANFCIQECIYQYTDTGYTSRIYQIMKYTATKLRA